MSALPDSIGGLKALTALDLAKCMSLTTLPESIGGLTALQTLTLDHCYALAALPAAIGELKSLTQLNINFCESLLALPDVIGGLVALEHLFMAMCVKLTALPKTIGDLKRLTVLTLGSCLSLAELPDAIGGLTALKDLDLEGCTNLVALPDSIGELGALTELNLEGCSSLATLPPAIETMPNLGPINGWEERPLSNYARFLHLARPRVNAEHPELANEVIDGIISDFWSVVCEARRAKLADPHDGTPYGEFLVGNLIHEIRRNKRRTCDFCGQKGLLKEDRFPVCWCGARRYCGLECQKLDWDRGHSRTCASGQTWSATDLDYYRRIEQLRIATEGHLEYVRKTPSGNPDVDDAAFIYDGERDLAAVEEERQALIAMNPPPADRERQK